MSGKDVQPALPVSSISAAKNACGALGHKGIDFSAMAAMFVGCMLVSVGVIKALSPLSTIRVLQSVWGVSNFWTASYLAVGLATIEALFGAALLAGIGRRVWLLATAVFFCILTISPIVQIITESKMGCGCGLTLPGLTPQQQQIFAIARNGLFASACAAAVYFSRSRGISCRPISRSYHET